MSVECSDSSVPNMDVDDSKIGYKRLLMDTDKLRSSVYSLKNEPFRVAAVCLGVLCLVLVVALIGQSVNDQKVQQEATQKIQSIKAEKDGLQQSLATAQTEKSKREERQRQLEESVERLTRRRDQTQNAYNSLAEELSKMRESDVAMKSSNDLLTKQLQQTNATVTKLQKDNAALSTARDLFQVEYNQAVKLKTTLEENYKVMKSERDILQNSFNNVSRYKDELQLSYNSLMTQVETLVNRLHVKDQAQPSQMDAATATKTLHDMYDILVKATEQLNSSYNNLLKEKQELEKSCGSVREERNSLMERNGNLTAERDQLQLEITRLNSTIEAKRCPSGWRSYMYSCYYTSGSKKNWRNSRDYCRNKGADLAVITSQDEMNFINKLYSTDKEVWIGLTDEGIEGHWTWVDGTPLNPNATFWGSGQPNSYDGRNQDCVEFWHRATGNGLWNDESCKIEQYWICEL